MSESIYNLVPVSPPKARDQPKFAPVKNKEPTIPGSTFGECKCYLVSAVCVDDNKIIGHNFQGAKVQRVSMEQGDP